MLAGTGTRVALRSTAQGARRAINPAPALRDSRGHSGTGPAGTGPRAGDPMDSAPVPPLYLPLSPRPPPCFLPLSPPSSPPPSAPPPVFFCVTLSGALSQSNSVSLCFSPSVFPCLCKSLSIEVSVSLSVFVTRYKSKSSSVSSISPSLWCL